MSGPANTARTIALLPALDSLPGRCSGRQRCPSLATSAAAPAVPAPVRAQELASLGVAQAKRHGRTDEAAGELVPAYFGFSSPRSGLSEFRRMTHVFLALTTALLLAQLSTLPASARLLPTSRHPPAAASAPDVKPAPSYDDLVRRIEACWKRQRRRARAPATPSTAGAFNPEIGSKPDLSIIARLRRSSARVQRQDRPESGCSGIH